MKKQVKQIIENKNKIENCGWIERSVIELHIHSDNGSIGVKIYCEDKETHYITGFFIIDENCTEIVPTDEIEYLIISDSKISEKVAELYCEEYYSNYFHNEED